MKKTFLNGKHLSRERTIKIIEISHHHISGPEGTPFEDGVFVAELKFPHDYPLSPPKMKFVSEMFHPNGKH